MKEIWVTLRCPNCDTPWNIYGREGEMKSIKCDECGTEFIRTIVAPPRIRQEA